MTPPSPPVVIIAIITKHKPKNPIFFMKMIEYPYPKQAKKCKKGGDHGNPQKGPQKIHGKGGMGGFSGISVGPIKKGEDGKRSTSSSGSKANLKVKLWQE